MTFSRRDILAQSVAVAGAALFRPVGSVAATPLTPACGDGALTRAQSAGPFYTPDTPLKADFTQDGPTGTLMTLEGFVLDPRCRPVSGALVDLWHSDRDGNYDNSGFKLRGHVFTDAQGLFRFRTIKPANYRGRTRHFHVKVKAPAGPILTTQLYFPGEPENAGDFSFDERLLMTIKQNAARFDFVVRA